MRRLAVAMLVSSACAATRPAPRPKPAREAPRAEPQAPTAEQERKAAPERTIASAIHKARAGGDVTAARRAALTARYLAFIAEAKTPRRAIRALADRARAAGATPLPAGGPGLSSTAENLAPGRRYVIESGTDLALIAVGSQPLSAGTRVIVTFVDPPTLAIAPRSPESRSGVAVADLVAHEDLDLAAWLSHPLALYFDAPGERELVIGDEPGEPLFVVPDLLPHLSRKVQRRGPVDKPERLDVLLAPSLEVLRQSLATHGIPARAITGGHISFAPAGAPHRIGAGGELVSGYGHAKLAVAFAAANALLSTDQAPSQTAVVIATTTRTDGHAEQLVARVLERIAATGETPADALSFRRVLARSAALAYAPGEGDPDAGVILNFRRDDTLPSTARRALRIAKDADVKLQLSQKREWSGLVRHLSQTGMDVVGIALPVRERGRPLSLLSTQDLYQGALLCRAWLALPLH